MKVVLHGSYFGDNFGDTLFCLMFEDYIGQLSKGNQIVFPLASSRARKFIGNNKSDLSGFLMPDRVVYIGGGYLGEPESRKARWYIRLVFRHLLLMTYYMVVRRKYAFYSVGAGPLSNVIVKSWVKLIINNSECIYVRDQVSYDFMVGLGVNRSLVKLGTDWVLNLANVVQNDAKEKVKVGIHLPSIALHDHYKAAIDDLVEFMGDRSDFHVFYFKDFYKPDFQDASYDYIKERLSAIEYVEYSSPHQMIEFISTLDVLISNKLHCCIVGSTQSVQTISLGVHEKTKRFFDQIGYGDNNLLLTERYDNFVLKCLRSGARPSVKSDLKARLHDMKAHLSNFIAEENR